MTKKFVSDRFLKSLSLHIFTLIPLSIKETLHFYDKKQHVSNVCVKQKYFYILSDIFLMNNR